MVVIGVKGREVGTCSLYMELAVSIMGGGQWEGDGLMMAAGGGQ